MFPQILLHDRKVLRFGYKGGEENQCRIIDGLNGAIRLLHEVSEIHWFTCSGFLSETEDNANVSRWGGDAQFVVVEEY